MACPLRLDSTTPPRMFHDGNLCAILLTVRLS
jgi:hypothetical protein